METDNKEKLTLKELAMAFSNNQKVLYFDDERELSQICRIVELREEEMTISNGDYQYDVSFDDVKLICLPLSDLTKEITYNGETFVPIVELAKIEAGNHNIDEVCTDIEDDGYALSIEYLPSWFTLYFNKKHCSFSRYDDGEGKDACYNDLRSNLYKWHFDIHNLIERGLAININDLPND